MEQSGGPFHKAFKEGSMSMKTAMVLGALLLVISGTLCIHSELPPGPEPAGGEPFAWRRDQLWQNLEREFVRARQMPCGQLQETIDDGLQDLAAAVAQLADPDHSQPDHPLWQAAQERMLAVAPFLAACPGQLGRYMETVRRLESLAKQQADHWPDAQNRLYRLIYGGRSAVEEIMLQSDAAEPLSPVTHVPSAAPGIKYRGLTLHSGDILVSRGGAATSALIARGSDYPGNFSHIALLHIDEQSQKVSVIEALIESGVVVSDMDHYLDDKKLRIMVLRLRPDLPAIQNKPDLAHAAARWALQMAGAAPIPYDFAMDYRRHEKMFCSEVVYSAYEQQGLKLWKRPSRISAPGTARWLAEFGVTHFTTLEPSDLEYDPRLVKVAEWRDPQTLFKDHVDNAATDLLLEDANNGAPLSFNPLLLPLARVVKGYSALKNRLGAGGPIPQGMSTTAALRNRWYTHRQETLSRHIQQQAEAFQARNGYRPPYWVLLELGREALDADQEGRHPS